MSDKLTPFELRVLKDGCMFAGCKSCKQYEAQIKTCNWQFLDYIQNEVEKAIEEMPVVSPAHNDMKIAILKLRGITNE